MAESIGKPKLQKVSEFFLRHNVDFIVIGGAAAIAYGSPIQTFDIDFCYRRTRENLERLALALKELQPTLRGAPPDLPFIIDAVSLGLGSNFTFNTSFGPLDLLGWVEPFGTYEELLPHTVELALNGVRVKVIGLDDLIAIKQHIARPKDQAALVQLLAIKRRQSQSEAKNEE